MALAFSPTDDLLVSGSRDGLVQLWSSQTGEPVGNLLTSGPGLTRNMPSSLDFPDENTDRHFFQSLQFSPNGKQIAGVCDSFGIVIFDTKSRTPLQMLDQTIGAYRLSYIADTQMLASVGWNKASHGNVRLTQLSTPGGAPTLGHRSAVHGLAFSPDGKTLATGAKAAALFIWDVETGQINGRMTDVKTTVRAVEYSPNGATLAAADYHGNVYQWDARSHKIKQRTRLELGAIRDIAFSSDAALLVTAGDKGMAILNATDFEDSHILSNGSMTYGVTLSPDGKWAVSAGDQGRLFFWSIATRKLMSSLMHHKADIIGLHFSEDSKYLYSSGADRNLRQLEVATGVSKVLDEFPDRLYWFDLHPKAPEVAVPTSGGEIYIHNLETSKTRWFAKHAGEVNEVAYTVDGKKLGSVSDDGTVRLWDSSSGLPLWRGPALLHTPASAVTHKGWRFLRNPGANPPAAAWAKTLSTQAVYAEQPPSSNHVCAKTLNGVELWDPETDTLKARITERASGVRARDDGCIAWTKDELWHVGMDGHKTPLLSNSEVSAVSNAQSPLMVAVRSADGLYEQIMIQQPQTQGLSKLYQAAKGVTALAMSHGALVLGYLDGSVEVRTADGSKIELTLVDTQSSQVTELRQGPLGTLLVGFAGGLVGAWNQKNGASLGQEALHGRVSHMMVDDESLHVLSDLGEYTTMDLSNLFRSRCELLHAVWKQVPTIWLDGRPQIRAPPADHDCFQASELQNSAEPANRITKPL